MAGLILQQSSRKSGVVKVRGLTTAATIWVAAGLGAAIGCGLWQIGVLGTLFVLLTLGGVKQVKEKVGVRVLLYRRSKSPQAESEESIRSHSD